MRVTRGSVWRCLALLVALLMARPTSTTAHEIPKDVMVRMFVKPDGGVMRLLVRVPLDAMRDVRFPLRGPGYLDLARADSLLRDAARLWVADGVTITENDVALGAARIVAVRASLGSDNAFRRYEDALGVLQGAPLPATTEVPWQQAMLDVLLEYPITRASAAFSINPTLAHLGVRTTTVLRFLAANGSERAFEYVGDPGLVQLDPSWRQAAGRFVRSGFGHILGGIDHLLFLLCLVIPLRRVRELIVVITSFTVAHSITLAASAAGYAPDALWFPPLIEVLIAASIVFMALENIVGARLHRRWLMAFGFGLVHGFGFSFALRETLQFAGAHLYTSLAAFNVGVELGQLLVLGIAVPVLTLLFRHLVAERAGVIVVSALVAHTAWHWMTTRWSTLTQYRVTWPTFDTLLLANTMRAAAVLLVLGAAAWVLLGVRRKRLHASQAAALTAPALGSAGSVGLLAVAVLASMFGARTGGAQRASMRTSVSARAQAVGFAANIAAAQDSVRSTMTGVYTAEQATKGKEVFNGTCVGCHTSVSQSGQDFAKRWMGKLLLEFYDYVSKLMPDSAPATLTEDEYVTVTAYVLKLNGMPPGERPLSADPVLLRGIRIDTLPTGDMRSAGSATTRRAHLRMARKHFAVREKP